MPKVSARHSAILVGIAVAAPCIWLSSKFGDPYFDLGALLVIGLILVGAVFVLIRENGGLLSGERIDRNQIAH